MGMLSISATSSTRFGANRWRFCISFIATSSSRGEKIAARFAGLTPDELPQVLMTD
jgi:hypothetical protein